MPEPEEYGLEPLEAVDYVQVVDGGWTEDVREVRVLAQSTLVSQGLADDEPVLVMLSEQHTAALYHYARAHGCRFAGRVVHVLDESSLPPFRLAWWRWPLVWLRLHPHPGRAVPMWMLRSTMRAA